MSVLSAPATKRGWPSRVPPRVWLLLLAVLGGLPESIAWAEATAASAAQPGACAAVAPCAKLADEARLLSRREQLDAALVSYQRAYAYCNDPVLLFNLARIYHRLNRLTEARDHYQRYLQAAPGDDPKQRERASQYLKSLTEDAPASPPPTAVTPPPNPNPPPQAPAGPTPIYKKWWFWTAIGGGVLAATALGVGLGLAAREPDFGGAPQYRPF